MKKKSIKIPKDFFHLKPLKAKSLITITNGGVLKLTKKRKDLQVEFQKELEALVSGKYRGVPMLFMHNITIKSIELKETFMFHIKEKDSAYLITFCAFTNGGLKYPTTKQK